MFFNFMKMMLMLTVFASLNLAGGCGLEDLADYSTPESTYESYLRHSATLSIVADHRSYRRAINCFSRTDRRWFSRNFERLKELDGVEVEEDIYRHLYRTKRKAYIFGKAVVPAGPSLDSEYNIKKLSPEEALLEVEDFEKDIKMIRERRGWRIKGLFGISEKLEQ